jgi:hypothetical protein
MSRLAAEKAQYHSRHIKGSSVSALEEGDGNITIAFAPSKTVGGRTGKLSEAAIAVLIDTMRSVSVEVSCQTRRALAIGLVLANVSNTSRVKLDVTIAPPSTFVPSVEAFIPRIIWPLCKLSKASPTLNRRGVHIVFCGCSP